MPLDAIFVSALAEELNASLTDMRIDKIQQPEKDVLLFQVRGRGETKKLLMSAGTGSARVHFTQISRENPQSPPMFCMLLRKYLTGARITSVTQPYLERILDIELDATNELGIQTKKRIVIEMLGKLTNIILVDEEGRIVDCLRKIDAEMSDARQVLPGLFYQMPPAQNKRDPFAVSLEELTQVFSERSENTVDSAVLKTFMGLSPLLCRELSYRCCGSADIRVSAVPTENLADCCMQFFRMLQNRTFMPVMLTSEDKPFDFSCMSITQYESFMNQVLFESYSELLDRFYTEREKQDRVKQKSQSLVKTIRNLRDRTERKLQAQSLELKTALDRERLREQGDLIKANLHRMHKGQSVLCAQDFYTEEYLEVEIPLDPKLSPQQNAAKYYKSYAKAKNAEIILTEQIRSAAQELSYLESVLEELSRAGGERDLGEIRRELTDGGYIKIKSRHEQKKGKQPEAQPLTYRSTQGIKILVGKNNLQNDRLTLKTAQKDQIWLHTQKIHGAHVIVQAALDEADRETILEAAMLAAFYSKARESENVPVDYTAVRSVKKPAGAKPGMVVYTDYKTVFVTPDAHKIELLKKE